MNRSIFSEIRYKMLHSGSAMYLFIGINVTIFLLLSLIQLIEFLFSTHTTISVWLTEQLSVPAYLPELLNKLWTPLTYMFLQRDFFHILFNMLWLFWMGRIFEDFLNKRQFIFTYLAGGLAGALFLILVFNLFPAFNNQVKVAAALGASASVSAIVIATATLLPNYTIHLLFFGPMRLKYLALLYIILDLIAIPGPNGGGGIAHLGGALLGFLYIKQLKKGNDWSKAFNFNFNFRHRLKVIKNPHKTSHSLSSDTPDQETIDRILDKISRSGYDSLSKKEKEQLFKASNNT